MNKMLIDIIINKIMMDIIYVQNVMKKRLVMKKLLEQLKFLYQKMNMHTKYYESNLSQFKLKK